MTLKLSMEVRMRSTRKHLISFNRMRLRNINANVAPRFAVGGASTSAIALWT